MELSLLSKLGQDERGGGGGGGGGRGQKKYVNDVSCGHEYMPMHALSIHAILKVGLIVMSWWWWGYIIWRVIVHYTPLLKIAYLQHDLLD